MRRVAPVRPHTACVIVGAVVVLAAGCSGSSVPEGIPIAVRVEVVQSAGHFGTRTFEARSRSPSTTRTPTGRGCLACCPIGCPNRSTRAATAPPD